MSKHTPGPWEMSYGWGTSVTTSTGSKIRQTTDRPLEERQANARLIASAPDLLEALRLILEEPGYELLDTHKAYALEAIAKAEGAT